MLNVNTPKTELTRCKGNQSEHVASKLNHSVR